MEHVTGFHISCVPRIPYVVERQYDLKGFHSFPARAGWRMDENGHWVKQESENPAGSLAGFLQSWLFFGLLIEVVRLPGPLNLNEFKEQDEYGYWHITTARLPEYLQRWFEFEVSSDSDLRQRERILRSQMILDEAHNLISTYCTVSNIGATPTWDIQDGHIISFMVLGETLSNATNLIMDELGLSTCGWNVRPPLGWGNSKGTLKRMIADKWCPRSVKILREMLSRSETGLLYALHLSHPKALHLDHTRCSEYLCRARTDSMLRRCLQTDQDCDCEILGPDLEKLTRVIREKKFALLLYRSENSTVDVVEPKPGVRYMILSHVWADGFGNSLGNGLSKCRLKRLGTIFERLNKAEQMLHSENPSGILSNDIPFWIDTLAIPTNNNSANERSQAIQYMHHLYRNASYTIVLDAGLMSQDSGTTYAEIAMKIMTSYWMTRLWTLQEAFLSKRLIFYFANRLVDLDDLERRYKKPLYSTASIAAHAYYNALLGPERERLLKGALRLFTVEFIESIWNAMQWRSTTRAEHETLAIATLLGLDTSQLDGSNGNIPNQPRDLDIDMQQRMKILLALICQRKSFSLPMCLLFSISDRLDLRGHRWAPKSWLTNHAVSFLSSPKTASAGLQLIDTGALVRCPGYKLYKATGQLLGLSIDITFPCDFTLDNWIRMTEADQLSELPVFKNSTLFVLTHSLNLQRTPQIALLVAKQSSQGGTTHVRTLRHVYIQRETDLVRIQVFRDRFKDHDKGFVFVESLEPDHQWCVDGLAWQSEMYNSTPSSSDFSTGVLAPLAWVRAFNWSGAVTSSKKTKSLSS